MNPSSIVQYQEARRLCVFRQKEGYEIKITIYSVSSDKTTKDCKCGLVLLRTLKYISEISSSQSAEKELYKTIMNFVASDTGHLCSKLQVKE